MFRAVPVVARPFRGLSAERTGLHRFSRHCTPQLVTELTISAHDRDRDRAPLPGIFRLFAIGELVGYKPCAILAASWWVSGDGQCRGRDAMNIHS